MCCSHSGGGASRGSNHRLAGDRNILLLVDAGARCDGSTAEVQAETGEIDGAETPEEEGSKHGC